MPLYSDRIAYTDPLDSIATRAVRHYGLGEVQLVEVIKVGYEDLNCRVNTTSGVYVLKMFSKQRSATDINRNVEILKSVSDSSVHHPHLLSVNGKIDYIDVSGVRMIAMDFIDGESFYDMDRAPDISELALIVSEAVKINQLDCHPDYLFDTWAIPNMKWMYDKVKSVLSQEGNMLVDKAFALYDSIPIASLPVCFVHGDLIKPNIIQDKHGKMFVVDFSVANVYPRINELAVMSSSLLFDEKGKKVVSLRDRVDLVTKLYIDAGGELSDMEKRYLFDYALPGAAMEYMGSVNERIYGGDMSDENRYWEETGLKNLREAL